MLATWLSVTVAPCASSLRMCPSGPPSPLLIFVNTIPFPFGATTVGDLLLIVPDLAEEVDFILHDKLGNNDDMQDQSEKITIHHTTRSHRRMMAPVQGAREGCHADGVCAGRPSDVAPGRQATSFSRGGNGDFGDEGIRRTDHSQRGWRFSAKEDI